MFVPEIKARKRAEKPLNAFRVQDGNCFAVTHDNGWTVSVLFADFASCDGGRTTAEVAFIFHGEMMESPWCEAGEAAHDVPARDIGGMLIWASTK